MLPNIAAALERAATIGMHPTSYVPELVRRLYALVAELEQHFPGRPFTPDGHLVGSIGEVVAAHRYGLTLLPCSAASHDAVTAAGLRVQIKATQATGVAMRSSCEHLLVLKLLRTGESDEVYNGPGAPAWDAAGKMQRNGQRPISLRKLRRLMESVPEGAKIPNAAF